MIDVTFATPDGQRNAYLAEPTGAEARPGVVVIHELFGLNEDIRVLTDRVASLGYLALAPDFFEGRHWTTCLRGAFRQLSAGSGEFFDAIEAARGYLCDHERASGKVGVIGFCLGGGFALLAASAYPFTVASVNYGEVPDDAERVLTGACPIVASYGGRDRSMRGRPERLQQALDGAGVEHDIKTYPAAGHSFLSTQPYPKAVRALGTVMGMHAGRQDESADDAWLRIDAFFSTHLRGG